MSKKILFPFSFDKDIHRGYSWAMELAAKMNATLFFFTAVPTGNTADQGLTRNVYHVLLEARGNYLQDYHVSNKGNSIARTERHIEKGDFTWSLLKFVKKTKFDIVVLDPHASVLSPTTVQDVVDHSNGVIILPEQREKKDFSPDSPITETKITEDFYDVLRESNIHKLPGNFFRTLGQDQKLFNYLRYFFRKNKPLPG